MFAKEMLTNRVIPAFYTVQDKGNESLDERSIFTELYQQQHNSKDCFLMELCAKPF